MTTTLTGRQLRALPKDLRTLAATATDHGWTVNRTNGGHLKWCPPKGQMIISSSSPSDHRGPKNLRAQLRRAGLAV